MATSTRTVVGVFDDYATAQRAIDDLIRNGFSRSDIELTSNDRLASDTAAGNTGLTGRSPRDTSGGGIAGFFRRLFGTDDEYSGRYEEAVRRGASIVFVYTDQDDRAAEIMDHNGALDIDERSASWGHSSGERLDTGDRSIPVVREDLHVGKRQVHRGGVRVFNRVDEQPVEEQVSLREEQVRVDRRPADRPATDADLKAHDEVIEVVETAEVPVVGKTARVVEEVIVGKETRERKETVRDTVRRSNVNVERIPGEEAAHGDYHDDFRRDFQTRYGEARGARYETYAPAYEYGYRMASDNRYSGRNWNDVESTLRTDYERTYPNSKWEQIKDSVRYGWEKVTGRR